MCYIGLEVVFGGVVFDEGGLDVGSAEDAFGNKEQGEGGGELGDEGQAGFKIPKRG